MYAQYSYLAAATAAQICADLAALACGETVIANLSAGCDKAATNIIDNSITSNWTVHDAAAGSGSVVIRSLNADGVSYKYVRIYDDNTNISLHQSEGWNAGTHVAVNASYVGASHAIPAAVGSAGRLFLMSGPRFVMISQNPSTGIGSNIVVEHSRDTPLGDTTYPCTVHSRLDSSSYSLFTSASSYPPRHKNPEAAGDLTGSGVWCVLAQSPVQNGISLAANLPTQVRGVGEAPWYPVMPINLILSKTATGTVNLPLGRVQGGMLVLMFGNNALAYNHLDEIVIGATTYVMCKLSAVGGGTGWMSWLIPKG